MAKRRWSQHECRDVLLAVIGSEDSHEKALLWECNAGAQALDLTGVQPTGMLVEQVVYRVQQCAAHGGLELGPVLTPPDSEWPPAARLLAVVGSRYNSQAIVSSDGSRRVMVWSSPAEMEIRPSAADRA